MIRFLTGIITLLFICTAAMCQEAILQGHKLIGEICNEAISLNECDGKLVKVNGPLSFMQHEIYFSLEKNYKNIPISAKEGDVVLLTEYPLKCSGEVEAMGKLLIRKKDCPENVKCTQDEYYVFVLKAVCLDYLKKEKNESN
ncbi:MAG: hypothetical protein HQL27_04075 [Candidatus Omnitrophica bacterium]|nr:hypothetical protein [Candidatus Omnitrophota bacterium]